MALSSSIQFIDAALSCTSPYALSYPQPKQKWLIRKHFLSLIQEYPNFTPSTAKFTHNDGTTVNLLYAAGDLSVSWHAPPVPLTIWLHENYPYMPPIVYVASNSIPPIHKDHPFVDLSGHTSSPYLQTWIFPKCNLTEFVHNLVKIFSHDHPLTNSSPAGTFTHPSLVSKMEAMDRLTGMIHYDLLALEANNSEEMEDLTKLQVELMRRDDIIKSLIIDLEMERTKLKDIVKKLVDEADVLMNWLRFNDVAVAGDGMEDGFEGEDEESKLVIECLAAERAIEDMILAMEKAVEEEVVPFDAYIRQVRVLGREQFIHRAKLFKLKRFSYSLLVGLMQRM